MLDGLFGQSNFGIVTRLTMWLTPLPRFRQYFSFGVRTREQLPALIDAAQRIKREGLVETNFGFYNDYKLLTYLTRHHRSDSLDLSELSQKDRRQLKSCVWFGEGAITAPSEEIGAAKRKLLQERLWPSTDHLIFAEVGGRNPLIDRVPDASLASDYWRKTGTFKKDLDPDRDRCGLIWICPLTSFQGKEVWRCVSLIEQTMREFSFEPIIGAQFHNLRAGRIIASIIYDRDVLGHDEQALVCHDSLLASLMENGFIPYRLPIHAMSAGLAASESYSGLIKKLKDVFDPAGILAPGRYV